MGVDVYVFLIKADGGYILVDAGAPTDGAAELLLGNLAKVMGNGELKLIVLTHGHPDHAGMLTTVAQAHPGAQIAFHEEEAPFILGARPHLSVLYLCSTCSSRQQGSSARQLLSHRAACREDYFVCCVL